MDLSSTNILISVASIYIIGKTASFISNQIKTRSKRNLLSQKAQNKRNQRDQTRRSYAKILTSYLHAREKLLPSSRKVEIAHSTAASIVNQIKAGELLVSDVIAVFSTRSLLSGTKLDITAEEIYGPALEVAGEYDKQLIEDKQSILEDNNNILYGVPVSIKDHIAIVGYDSTCGLATHCFHPETEDAVIVKLLKKAGAIPIVRGNVPQCLMLPESDNLIWGQSKNPWNVKKTPGGSSGGDSALVATRSVPIAIGTDIGGSLRIPAQSCGTFALKPTPGRISSIGIKVSRPDNADGQQIIKCTPGPLANSTQDLALVMRSWLTPEMSHLDPTIPYTGFDYKLYHGLSNTISGFDGKIPIESVKAEDQVKLKIGYFDYDGYVDYCPTAKRAVKMAIDALKANGHQIVEFKPPNVEKAALLYLSILGAEGSMRSFIDSLDGEELHPMYYEVFQIASLPDFARPLIAAILKIIGEERSAVLSKQVSSRNAYDHWADIREFIAYVKNFTEIWKEQELDAVVCPGFHIPAFDHNESGNQLPLFVSCFLWNVVHYPVGSVPVTKVRKDEENYIANAKTKDRISHFAHRSMQDSEGLPFGVQVAALPNHDELVLRVMNELECALGTGADGENAMVSPFTMQLDNDELTL